MAATQAALRHSPGRRYLSSRSRHQTEWPGSASGQMAPASWERLPPPSQEPQEWAPTMESGRDDAQYRDVRHTLTPTL